MMDIQEKVIFDTNFLLEKRMSNFFGKQDQLVKFAKVSEIIIPDMVIRELEERYKRDFEENKNSFMGGLLHNVLNHDIEDIDISEKISKLKKDIEIEYKTIYLHDNSVLEDIKEMALTKTLPFKAHKEYDAGFKDTYIYFTIKEYLKTLGNERVFFVTGDSDFRKSFDNVSKVIGVEDYDEFKKYSITRFTNDYFLRKLSANIGVKIIEIDVIDYWDNIYDNDVVLVEVKKEEKYRYVVEVDAGEINEDKTTLFSTYKPFIEGIIKSDNWANTHTMAGSLLQYTRFLSDDDIINLFEVLCNNNQVTGAYGYGVKDFYDHLYSYKKDILPMELRKKVDLIIKPK